MTALRSNGRVGFGTTTPNSLVEIKTENSSSIDPTNHVTEALRLVLSMPMTGQVILMKVV